MTEFRASRARIAVHAAGGLFFLTYAVVNDELGTVARSIGYVLGIGILINVVVMARTRVIVTADEIAIQRGFGKLFRAAPQTVTVKWTPLVNGIGRGHGWLLGVVRKSNREDGIHVPLSAWPPKTIAALREHLDSVTGTANSH